jgi:hypothetical protein
MTYIVTSTETIQVKKIGARILRPIQNEKEHKQ